MLQWHRRKKPVAVPRKKKLFFQACKKATRNLEKLERSLLREYLDWCMEHSMECMMKMALAMTTMQTGHGLVIYKGDKETAVLLHAVLKTC